ncbi:MAG: two-component system nitrogen regulation response regulator NtrX, partial [Phenylobacterium sp.]
MTGLKILVVDDEPHIRGLLCEILALEDYQSTPATDGVDAMAKWHQSVKSANPFDLMVIDLKMPKMGGEGLLKMLRQTGSTLPVIVLTGHADLEDAYTLLAQYGVSDFISKHLTDATRLLFSVKNALEKYGLQQQLETINEQLEVRVTQRTAELEQAKIKAEV